MQHGKMIRDAYRDSRRKQVVKPYIRPKASSRGGPFLPSAIKAGSNDLVLVLNWYWRSPESGVLWYKSKQLKKRIAAPCESRC